MQVSIRNQLFTQKKSLAEASQEYFRNPPKTILISIKYSSPDSRPLFNHKQFKTTIHALSYHSSSRSFVTSQARKIINRKQSRHKSLYIIINKYSMAFRIKFHLSVCLASFQRPRLPGTGKKNNLEETVFLRSSEKQYNTT